MPIREQQTTNKQHAIPQSIMSVEFKIIGDLTLKQFFFLLIFCGLAYASFMAVQPFVFKWLLVIFFVVTGLCFAFLPLGDRGLDVWIVNFLRAMFLPNQFVYRKQEEIPNVFLYQNLDVLKSELITLTPTSSRRKIEAYLEQQEAPADKLDFDEKSYILKVKEAYSSGYAGFSSSSVTTTVIEDVSPIQVVTPQVETVVPSETSTTGTPQVQNLTELELPAPRSWQSVPVSSTPQVVQIPVAQPQPRQQEEIIKSQSRMQSVQPTVKQHQKPAQPQDNYYSPSMTPDMHAGRRFINLADGAGRGDIILPIRGERVLNSLGNSQFDQNEADRETQKVQQLDELINQIKSKQIVQKQLIESQKIKDEEEAKKRQLEGETQKTKQEETIRINEESKHIQEQEKLEAEKGRADRERLIAEQKAREQAANEQERLQKLRDQEEALRRQKEELLKKQRQEDLARQLQAEPKPEPQAIPLKSAQINETPTTPNTIWGVVVTIYQGNKVPVPAVVVIIRNQRKEVVRAVKTSGQGKFGITNPLINGSYTIEVDKERRSGLTFDLTAFEAKGAPIPTIEIVGKV
jgi:hypothetical protein